MALDKSPTCPLLSRDMGEAYRSPTAGADPKLSLLSVGLLAKTGTSPWGLGVRSAPHWQPHGSWGFGGRFPAASLV